MHGCLYTIYMTTSHFPESEKFGLTNQLRRDAVSMTLNIAEGFSRKGQKDKARFINQAYSTTCEVLACLILAQDLGFLSEKPYTSLRSKTELITNKLNALHKSITKTNDFTTKKFTTSQ